MSTVDRDLLTVLYGVYDPRAPKLPEHLLHVWDEAVARQLLTRDGRQLTGAGMAALKDGLQAIADRICGVKATTSLGGGVLAVVVSLADDWECPRTSQSAWWAVHRAFFPVTRHCFCIELH